MSLRWGDPKYSLDMPVSPRGLLQSGRDSEAGLMTVLNTGRTLQCRQRPGRGLGVLSAVGQNRVEGRRSSRIALRMWRSESAGRT